MRDRTRRFTVGLGDGKRHIRVLAADAKTRAWADRHGPLMNVILWKFEQQVAPLKLASDPRAWDLPAAIANVETPRSLAARFEKLLRVAFPEEALEVRPELQS